MNEFCISQGDTFQPCLGSIYHGFYLSIIVPSLLFELLQLRSHLFPRRLRLDVFLHRVGALRDRRLEFDGKFAVVSLTTQ